MNDYAQALIRKHRVHGVLIDTNLTILLLVGRADKRRIAGHKRTSAYSIQDYELLEQFLGEFDRIVTTPHLLTETSNLLPELRSALKSWISKAYELWTHSITVVNDSCFSSFGLSDAAISVMATQGFLVVTSDAALCDTLQRKGGDAIYFSLLPRL